MSADWSFASNVGTIQLTNVSRFLSIQAATPHVRYGAWTHGDTLMLLTAHTSDYLDAVAAELFFSVAGVEDVRRKDEDGLVRYYVLGSYLDRAQRNRLVDAEIELSDHPCATGKLISMEIIDRFGREQSADPALERMRRVTLPYISAISSAGAR